MWQLIHNGVIIPEKYKAKGFHILFKGRRIDLTPKQEEMAVAWVRKLGTPYAKDRRFTRNFFKDFKKALGIKGRVSPEDFDFTVIEHYLEEEKENKANLSREEQKLRAKLRRVIREARKERYGYAVVDGKRVEISNYTVEPSSIFMGRGKHPLRGRWKEGPSQEDIILNLSPDAPRPAGNWKEIVWQPDSLWIAKWRDKLRGKMKHVWLSDTFRVKQLREIEKYNKARELENYIEKVREHIKRNLHSEDLTRRKIATVCFLIDELKMRVGDEKDKDEADTVGATTLRPEHVKIGSDGFVIFNFLGKDSVKWKKKVKLPDIVINNLREFASEAKSPIFSGIESKDVNSFLSEVMPGLTAKVFRTYHATRVVKAYLSKAKISRDDDLLKKHVAVMANLEAAKICNHKRKIPKNWSKSLEKKKERLKKYKNQKRITKKTRERMRKLRLRIREQRATRDFNLRTSLKSYIDPRVYYEWFLKVDFNWRKFYPKALQRKFSWIEEETAERLGKK